MKMRLVVCMLATSLVAAPACWPYPVFAGEFFATENGSPRQDGVPGEYFFQLGVKAVKANDYRHAVAMYKVAASWAYKPAEYNLGIIFAKGEGGVPEDRAQGLAWLTLAAERNDNEYTEARDRVRGILEPGEIAEADSLLADLTKVYGDAVALPRAKARWHEARTSATGSHLGFVGNLRVGAPTSQHSDPGGQKFAKKANVQGDVVALAGTNSVDGSVAYRELRATDNPYDPKFDGTVVVGPLVPAGAKDDTQNNPASQPDK